jgi:hypothetical protein
MSPRPQKELDTFGNRYSESSSSESVRGMGELIDIARRASSRMLTKSSWFESVCSCEGGSANSWSFDFSKFSTNNAQNEALI